MCTAQTVHQGAEAAERCGEKKGNQREQPPLMCSIIRRTHHFVTAINGHTGLTLDAPTVQQSVTVHSIRATHTRKEAPAQSALL